MRDETMTFTPPTKTQRDSMMASKLRDVDYSVGSALDRIYGSALKEYIRYASHSNHAFQAYLRSDRRKAHEIMRRRILIRSAISQLDLTKEADHAVFLKTNGYDGLDLTKTLAQDFKNWAQLPTPRALTTAEETEFPVTTTIHEIDEAFTLELRDLVGSDIHLLGTTAASLSNEKLTNLSMLRRRRDEIKALSVLPDDPYDMNLWGHDTRLKSLAMVPTGVETTIPFSPSFDSETRSYLMEHRPDQVFRVDATAEDPRASIAVVKETGRLLVRVTSESGKTEDYLILSSKDATLKALTVRTGNNVNVPISPAFSKTTKAYTIPVPISALSASNVLPVPTTKGASASVTIASNTVTIVTTAADGSTTDTVTITQASG